MPVEKILLVIIFECVKKGKGCNFSFFFLSR